MKPALVRGRDAFARRRWREAFTHLREADERESLAVEDLERLATTAFLVGEDPSSLRAWGRAHTECLHAGDVPRAIRCAFWTVQELFLRGETARAMGWLARSQRLLAEKEPDCPECGLILVLAARIRLEADIEEARALIARANAIRSRFDDAELRAFGCLVEGQLHAWSGKRMDAARLFDEAMVAVTVDGVSPIGVGTVYCAVVDSCHRIADLGRVREWTQVLSEWCDGQPDLVSFRGLCRVHRAEILRLLGAWDEAREEARLVIEGLVRERSFPAAFHELAEVHRLRGEFARAEEAYREAERHGQAPAPGLALLRLAQQDAKAAEAAIGRALSAPSHPCARARALAASTEIQIALGDLDAARRSVEELATAAAASAAPYLRALSAHATGEVLLAEGDPLAALASLRTSWMLWQELELPYDAARTRVALARTYQTLDDPDAAAVEFDAARRVFERLGAVPDQERIARLSRARSRADAGLTPRERQVIARIAAGKTNRELARELGISERTVDRHVSNILTKLDLPNRAAATAYACEHGLV